jgi:hypothetical protein
MHHMTHKQFADAQEANLGFAIQQTSHIEAEVYRIQYPDLDYASMVPVDMGAGEFVKSVTYFSMDRVGEASWINGNASDIPVVGVSMEKHETEVRTAAIGYDFGFEEINQARMLGISLDTEKAAVARRACEQLVYDVCFLGDASVGYEGLFDYTGVPTEAIPADGSGSSALWSAKTPDLIIRDVNKVLTGLYSATNTVSMADTLILPVERFQTIASTRLTDTSMTVLEFIRQNNVYTAMTGQPLMIRGMRGLTQKGAGSTARMIAYRRSPEVLKLHMPMPHRFLPVQVVGLQYKVPGVFRLGGLDIRLPKEVRYGDGI